jgi:citronellol/citronellal dehydrogenase
VHQQPLEGRVAIITGSSRGIGRALALRFAREGADVVITGKSEEPTERLPGSIHTVAQEVEAMGRRALPVRVDVRSEEDVRNMVEKTIETFGRLDILVNNASALWWEPLLKTPPKRYDLMWEVNARGTYLCMYYALPHLITNGWGHVVTFGPPISTEPNPGYACYMTTKMGMTRLAIGVAAEHMDDNVASNALWPATPIESQATINWGSKKMGEREQWRSPEILCDSTMEVLKTEPKELTGRQLVDEELLRERGWSRERLDSYWLGDGPPERPVWIDGRAGSLM